jgi:hypothetical protein
MSKKVAIYSPPKKSQLPHIVAVIKNGRVKDAFAAETLGLAESLQKSLTHRVEARGDA